MALALSLALGGIAFLLLLPSTRRRLLARAMLWLRCILERLWDRYPRSFDASSIVLIAFAVCLVVVLPPALTILLLLRAGGWP